MIQEFEYMLTGISLMTTKEDIFYTVYPSKDCTPSGDDIVLTRRLKEAGLLLNVPLADHIIIGGDWYYSFKEQETL